MKDWREEFVVCKHIKEGSRNIRGMNFRVCCEDCYEKGFLKREKPDFAEFFLRVFFHR